jgi:hypothetical protein
MLSWLSAKKNAPDARDRAGCDESGGGAAAAKGGPETDKSDAEDKREDLVEALEKHLKGAQLTPEIDENLNMLWFTLKSAEGETCRRLHHRYPVLLDTEPPKHLNPTQVLLFGHTGVGKTTLLEFLKYPCLKKDKDRNPELNVHTASTSKAFCYSGTKSATRIKFDDGTAESNVHLCNGILISDLPDSLMWHHISELFKDNKVPNWLKQMTDSVRVSFAKTEHWRPLLYTHPPGVSLNRLELKKHMR